jgi:hypothetical protein
VIDSAKLPSSGRRASWRGGGFLTGGCRRNRAYLEDKAPSIQRSVPSSPRSRSTLRLQGLLVALEPRAAARLVTRLRAAGIAAATIVGRATAHRDAWVYLT